MDREALPDRVRRGDALALPVARAADAEDHRVDPVAVAFGIFEPLEHEQCRALAHHEPVGAGIERSGARRRQCADLAELHEGRHTHVVVDAAGDRCVEPVIDEPLDGDAHRRQTRCARGVGSEVRTAEVEQVGDPSGHDVGEFAGHRVFVDLAEVGEEMRPRLGDDVLALLGAQRGERLGELSRSRSISGSSIRMFDS